MKKTVTATIATGQKIELDISDEAFAEANLTIRYGDKITKTECIDCPDLEQCKDNFFFAAGIGPAINGRGIPSDERVVPDGEKVLWISDEKYAVANLSFFTGLDNDICKVD